MNRGSGLATYSQLPLDACAAWLWLRANKVWQSPFGRWRRFPDWLMFSIVLLFGRQNTGVHKCLGPLSKKFLLMSFQRSTRAWALKKTSFTNVSKAVQLALIFFSPSFWTSSSFYGVENLTPFSCFMELNYGNVYIMNYSGWPKVFKTFKMGKTKNMPYRVLMAIPILLAG